MLVVPKNYYYFFLPECPGWHYINDKCYYFSDNAFNFSEAKVLCQENGAKIFEPKNPKINKMVHDIGKKGYWYWIGIVRHSGPEILKKSRPKKTHQIK